MTIDILFNNAICTLGNDRSSDKYIYCPLPLATSLKRMEAASKEYKLLVHWLMKGLGYNISIVPPPLGTSLKRMVAAPKDYIGL